MEESKGSQKLGLFVSTMKQKAQSAFQAPESKTALRSIGDHLQVISNQSSYSCIGVGGFASKKSSLINTWQPLHKNFPDANSYVLEWNVGNIFQIGLYLSTAFINRKLLSLIPDSTTSSSQQKNDKSGIWRQLDKAVNNKYVDHSLVSLNTALENFIKTWEKSRQHAKEAGEELAHAIIKGNLGKSPLILTGVDLGTEVIFSALSYLSKKNYLGSVSTVVLLGSTIMFDENLISEALKPVSGTTFNFYSKQDVFLRYLVYRSECKESLLGLRAINKEKEKNFIGVEDVNLTTAIGIDHFKYERDLNSLLDKFSRRIQGQL